MRGRSSCQELGIVRGFERQALVWESLQDKRDGLLRVFWEESCKRKYKIWRHRWKYYLENWYGKRCSFSRSSFCKSDDVFALNSDWNTFLLNWSRFAPFQIDASLRHFITNSKALPGLKAFESEFFFLIIVLLVVRLGAWHSIEKKTNITSFLKINMFPFIEGVCGQVLFRAVV